ncbi:MAG: acetoacetate decarboxylase family protein [Desulfobacterales bacterium]|nr:MAG: acetoacetate decarboxylase family protein [Desulfobacterales bacterium]
MNHDFFRGIKQWEFNLREMQFKLPVFYYDTTTITAIYTASTSKVKKLLPLPQMNPLELSPGKCLVAFVAFEYRETDIDPYNEFAIAFLITYDKPQIPFFTAFMQMYRRRMMAYVWQLPVTTEIARVGGVELYGYPKFIADIEFQKEDDQLSCHLSETGNKILSLRGAVLPVTRGKNSRIITYSLINDIPLVTNIHINQLEFAENRDKQAAELEIGSDHSICEELQKIGLSATPIQYQYSPLNQAILFAGRNLMDD